MYMYMYIYIYILGGRCEAHGNGAFECREGRATRPRAKRASASFCVTRSRQTRDNSIDIRVGTA